jgi:pimeloyl-ACP methyl ester carboxylesterase
MTPARPPTVVLIHHFGGSRSTWSAVIEQLGQPCVAPDLRGAGGSTGETSTIENDADDVIGRCDALGVGRLVVVGHSRGARVAMAIAARQPERVAGLVLVAPSPPTPEPMTDDGRATLAGARDDRSSAGQLVSRSTGEPLPTDLAAAAADDVLAADPSAWRAWVEVGSRQDLTGMVAAITCPVTVLSGDRDSAVPTDVVEREVVARLHRAQLVRVPGAGHLLPLESPGVVADAIRRMLARVSIEPAGIDSVRALSDSDWVTPPTRRALQERAAWRSQGPTFLSPDELVLLAAACDAMVPQDGPDDPGGVRYRVDIAGEIDRRLASGDGNGWRYDALPGDGDTYRLGLAAIDEAAGGRFRDLSRSDRLRMLTDIRAGAGDGPAWRSRGLDPRRVLEEWLADAVEVYYSHPGGGYADLGYAGFADARGWRHVQLNQLDRQETPLPPN